MKVLLLYRPNSEHARMVEEFVHEFQRREAARHIELLDVDSRDGSATASLYDIMQHPAILVLADDGQVLQMWVGPQLPMMDEVASYANSGANFFVASPQ